MVMQALKFLSAVQANRLLSRSEQPLWQRTYYERIIRDDDELERIRRYIVENPLRRHTDPENPTALPPTGPG